MKKLLFLLALSLSFQAFAAPDDLVNKRSNGKKSESRQAAAAMAEKPAYNASSLGIKGLDAIEIPKEVLKANAKTFDNGLKFTPAKEQTVIYFPADDTEAVDKPQEDGYYREILGKDEKGRIIAQDFYQDTKTAQTAPFILLEGGERNFSTEVNDGRIVWFDRDGEVSQIGQYNQGKLQDWNVFIRGGEVVGVGSEEGVVLLEDGNIRAVVAEHGIKFFYPNGASMLEIDDESENGIYAWDKSGKPVDPESVEAESLELIERLSFLIN